MDTALAVSRVDPLNVINAMCLGSHVQIANSLGRNESNFLKFSTGFLSVKVLFYRQFGRGEAWFVGRLFLGLGFF